MIDKPKTKEQLHTTKTVIDTDDKKNRKTIMELFYLRYVTNKIGLDWIGLSLATESASAINV